MIRQLMAGAVACLLATTLQAATDYPTGYIKCAQNTGATCSFSGTRSVALGKAGSFVYGTFTNSVACSSSNFPSNSFTTSAWCSYAGTTSASSSAASSVASSVASSSSSKSSSVASSVANSSSSTASSVTTTSYLSTPGNPIIRDRFTADPSAFTDNGRVYLYTGVDEAAVGGTDYVMNSWRVYSSANMVDWTDHGSPLNVGIFSWAKGRAWASHVVKNGGKYWWYVCVEHKNVAGMAIGVAVSDYPTGPFKDAKGSALLTNDKTTQTDIWWDDIDPAVFVDGDGSVHMWWGNTVLKHVKLKSNMIELDGSINTISLSYFTEAPFVHKRGSTYYLSYANNFPENIAYATSSSVNGPWTYRGIIQTPNFNVGTNHQAIVELNGQSYIIYHTAALPTGGDYRRSVAVDKLFYNSDGTIKAAPQTSTGVNGTRKRLQSYNFTDRYVRHSNFDVLLDPSVSPAMDAQWKIVPGLANSGSGYVSFESVNVPGYYLRHVDFDGVLAKNDGTTTFKQDATFKVVSGLASSGATSFQSYNFTDRYLRHSAYVLRIDPISTTTDKQDATFRIVD
jgi:hypothetical protein